MLRKKNKRRYVFIFEIDEWQKRHYEKLFKRRSSLDISIVERWNSLSDSCTKLNLFKCHISKEEEL